MPDHEIKRDQNMILDVKQDVRVGLAEGATPSQMRVARQDLHEDKHEIRQDRRDERRDNN